MSTWSARVAQRLEALLDPRLGPYPAERENTDADMRRLHSELDAMRVRFSDHR